MVVDAIARLSAATDLSALFDGVLNFTRLRGFAGFFALPRIARDNPQGPSLVNEGFSPDWAAAYRSELYRSDPLPDIALSIKVPFRWDQAASYRPLAPFERRYLDLLGDFGMGRGLVYPLFGHEARIGLIGLGLHPDLESISPSVRTEIQLALQTAYQTYCSLSASGSEHEAELSDRERDVLYWLTRSKSNSAIAAILAISPGTVDTYLRRIFRKLGVTDRVGAAIAAVERGHVIPDERRRETPN